MSLQDITIASVPLYDKYRDFNNSTHFVVDFFRRYLIGFKFKKFKKISIRIFPTQPKRKIFDANDVLEINIMLDLNDFFLFSESIKAHFLSKLIIDSVKEVGDKSLDEICTYAYQEFLAKNCENNFIHGELVYSDDMKYYGLVLCEHKSSNFNIYALMYTSKGFPHQKSLLVQCEPYSFVYETFLGKVKWDNGLTLYASDNKRALQCRINVNNSIE